MYCLLWMFLLMYYLFFELHDSYCYLHLQVLHVAQFIFCYAAVKYMDIWLNIFPDPITFIPPADFSPLKLRCLRCVL